MCNGRWARGMASVLCLIIVSMPRADNIECQEGVGDASTGTVLEINPGIAFMPFVTFENEPHAYNWFVFRQPNGAISPSTATLNTLVTANQNFQFGMLRPPCARV